MPKSALVMSEYQNNLMPNQCIEQCAIYTFFTCGSYLGWAFWPNIPFLAILGSNAKGEITKRSFRGWRYSALGHEDLYGWMISSCLSEWLCHRSGLSWGGILVVQDRPPSGGSSKAAYFGRLSVVSMRAPILLRVVLFREGVWCDVCVHMFG